MPATSIHEKILDAALARIVALNLTGIGSRVYVYEMALDGESVVELPCVMLSLEGQAEQVLGGTNGQDDIGYPVVCLILDVQGMRDDAALRDKRRLWRQQIRRAFISQRLAGVTEVMVCNVTPQLIVDPQVPKYEFIVSAMLLTFVAREPRG
jgi:hypothetical protein